MVEPVSTGVEELRPDDEPLLLVLRGLGARSARPREADMDNRRRCAGRKGAVDPRERPRLRRRDLGCRVVGAAEDREEGDDDREHGEHRPTGDEEVPTAATASPASSSRSETSGRCSCSARKYELEGTSKLLVVTRSRRFGTDNGSASAATAAAAETVLGLSSPVASQYARAVSTSGVT